MAISDACVEIAEVYRAALHVRKPPSRYRESRFPKRGKCGIISMKVKPDSHRLRGVILMSIVKASSKYQVAIPKRIRTKLGIKPGQRLLVSDKDGSVMFTPIPADPIAAFRGALKGQPSLTEELLRERQRDLEHE